MIRSWLIGLVIIAHITIIVCYYFYAPILESNDKAWWTWYYYHAEKGMTVFSLFMAYFANKLKPIEKDMVLFAAVNNLLIFGYYSLCALIPKYIVFNSWIVAIFFLLSFLGFFAQAFYLKHFQHVKSA